MWLKAPEGSVTRPGRRVLLDEQPQQQQQSHTLKHSSCCVASGAGTFASVKAPECSAIADRRGPAPAAAAIVCEQGTPGVGPVSS